MFLNSYILVFLMHAILFVYSWAFLHLQFLPMHSPIPCTCSFFQCILLFTALAVSFSVFSCFLYLQFLSVYSPVSCTCSFFQCILLFPALAVSSNRLSYFYTCFLDCRSPDFQHLFSFDFEIIFPLMYS